MTTPGLPHPPPTLFSGRRARVLEALGDGVMIVPAGPVQHGGGDMERPYVPGRELYYLTGATEPDTVAVLAGGDEPRFVLFTRERDPGAELWAGARLGVEGAAERFQPDACHPLAELAERLPTLMEAGRRVHYRFGGTPALDRLVLESLRHARARGARRGTGPRGVVDPGEILDELRLVKDGTELALLRRAAEVSAEGHRAGAAVIAPDVGEWIVEAAIDAAFRAHGAGGPAYETIVGTGANACVLHYVTKDDTIRDGDLVLVDAGAEYGLYNGDITRTYPASGVFGARQREVYDIVDGARDKAIASAAPGATIADVHLTAARALTEGLCALGVLRGDVEGLLESAAYRPFFPHQTSHWLGLYVHDPGDYARGGAPRRLEAGMVFTVEPGLYFAPGGEGVPDELAGIGVRIEDDVAVTEDGCEVLTRSLPTQASEVEALVQAR